MTSACSPSVVENFRKARSRSRQSRFRRLLANPVRTALPPLIHAMNRKSGTVRKVQAKTFWGEEMSVVLPDPVSAWIYRFGFFEAELTEFFLLQLEPGQTFVDVGAQFGFFSRLARFLVGDQGAVYSFEPTPSTHAVLKANMGQFENATPEQKGAWSEAGNISINDYGPAYCAFNSAYEARLPDDVRDRIESKTHDVAVVRLDDYFREKDISPDLIKIDTESSELEILKGLENTLKVARPMLSVEVGDFDVSGAPQSRELVDFIQTRGYRPVELADGKLVDHEKRERYGYKNIFFLPE